MAASALTIHSSISASIVGSVGPRDGLLDPEGRLLRDVLGQPRGLAGHGRGDGVVGEAGKETGDAVREAVGVEAVEEVVVDDPGRLLGGLDRHDAELLPEPVARATGLEGWPQEPGGLGEGRRLEDRRVVDCLERGSGVELGEGAGGRGGRAVEEESRFVRRSR